MLGIVKRPAPPPDSWAQCYNAAQYNFFFIFILQWGEIPPSSKVYNDEALDNDQVHFDSNIFYYYPPIIYEWFGPFFFFFLLPLFHPPITKM